MFISNIHLRTKGSINIYTKYINTRIYPTRLASIYRYIYIYIYIYLYQESFEESIGNNKNMYFLRRMLKLVKVKSLAKLIYRLYLYDAVISEDTDALSWTRGALLCSG